jgi:hypothetical protein
MKKPALKLVEPTVEVDTLEGYEPLLLSTVEILDVYWPQTAAVLQRCVDKAMHGEMTMDDIYEGIKAGRMYALIAKNDEGELPDVALALILETQAYPQFTVLNIAALGGRELDLLKSRFWKHVCSWAFMNGVRTMQASVSPAMARILKRYGFNKIYETVRLDLTEM